MTTAPIGRREQNRAMRHEGLMAAATEIVAERGLEGLTMQAVADRVGCAVGTIYTYFASKSALLAELQISAIGTISESYELSRELWDDALERAGSPPPLVSLVRLVAFSELFTAGPQLFPREFELLQALISSPRAEQTPEDAQRVRPYALVLISSFAGVLDAAVSSGALAALPDGADHDEVVITRTLRWAGGLNGALQVSNATGDGAWLPNQLLDGRALARGLAHDLVLGWGAPPGLLLEAEQFIAALAEADQLLRSGRQLGEAVELTE